MTELGGGERGSEALLGHNCQGSKPPTATWLLINRHRNEKIRGFFTGHAPAAAVGGASPVKNEMLRADAKTVRLRPLPNVGRGNLYPGQRP